MDIRSVTYFFDPQTTKNLPTQFLSDCLTAFEYPVQSIRLATTPFPEWLTAPNPTADLEPLAESWHAAGANYVSIGPVLLHHDPKFAEAIPELLALTEFIFTSAEIGSKRGEVDLARCQQVARLILKNSRHLPDGFGNLYFTALANCPAGSPYFPVAYHDKGSGRFAIAVEAADIALEAIKASQTLTQARQNLIEGIETAARKVTKSALRLASQYNIPFYGIDFSLAPYPTEDKSLGGALESLGIPYVGAAGSLFASGFITDAIERARFQRCGFSGLMLPVLEDSILAKRAASQQLTIQSLLSYSAVCGVGLDTIPLPGDVTEAQLTAILMDTAVLAARLNKPLTARLMPMPQKSAGDPIEFDFPYFANSRVMAVEGEGISHLLSHQTNLEFNPITKTNHGQNINDSWTRDE